MTSAFELTHPFRTQAFLKSLDKSERERVVRCSQDLLAQAKLSKKDSNMCTLL